MRVIRSFGWMLLLAWPLPGLSQHEWRAAASLEGFLGEGANPFWLQANTLGQVSAETEALGVLEASYRTFFSEDRDLEAGVSAFYDYAPQGVNRSVLNEYYAALGWRQFRLLTGARARPEQYQGLSSINGDILWTGNARPLPGVELGTREPLWIWDFLGAEGGLAHYWLNDDRYVKDAYVHYKFLALHLRFSPRSHFTAGLHHYAQWGGDNPERGPQPTTFSDFMKIFLGMAGGDSAAEFDQKNALGNHIGSYRFHYRHTLREGRLEGYYQTIFEDASGRSFLNFPDGVWGVYWELPERSPLRALLYEYVQTTWQSGLSALKGNDNYFNHGGYLSGWTYFGNVIGLPFFTPNADEPGIANNMVVAHHLGARAEMGALDLRLRASYVQNRGARGTPYDPFENVLYAALLLQHPLGQNARLGLSLGADFSDLSGETFALGLSLRYTLRHGVRM